ncbi:unnamed protein product [Calicophoron daubneyi]|uniref:Zinc finger CCCH-type with G patch domain-containing protein n=1 Tax=Calicophoron daubneyi TaxID=300641 RepID=A0AAV2TT76_CALDB
MPQLILKALSVDAQELAELKATLAQLTSQLDSKFQRPDYAELLTLRDELTELIRLKEEQVLALAKNSLLTEVENKLRTGFSPVGNQSPTAGLAVPHAQSSSENLSDAKTEDEKSLIGQKCSVPGWTPSGKFVRHNAIIFSAVDSSEADSSVGDADCDRVRVFLAHPTRSSEVPCQHFITTGNCRRGIRCTYSHGNIADIKDLGEWREANLDEYMVEGKPCLVKESESPHALWRFAHLLHTDLESNSCVIEWGANYSQSPRKRSKRTSYNSLEESVVNVPIEWVHIVDADDEEDQTDECSDINQSDEYSDSDTNVKEDDYTDGTMEQLGCSPTFDTKNFPNHKSRKVNFHLGGVLFFGQSPTSAPSEDSKKLPNSPPPSDGTTEFAAWQAHTRGIGSRIMARMGYTGSGGIGIAGQGWELPVALKMEKFQILPRRWNKRPCLDRVVDKSENPHGKHAKRERTDAQSKDRPGSRPYAHPHTKQDIFNFLNSALSRTSENNRPKSSESSPSCSTDAGSGSLRVQLFKVQEKINQTYHEIRRAKQSIERNQGKDRIMTKQAEDRLSALRQRLSSLQTTEKTLELSHSKQTKDKKLRVF